MAAAAGGGRRRIQTNTTEDNALNMIAREAEAKLAAKRAARAEARSIRMKELERMQKEADEKMDKEYRRTLMNEEAIKKRIQSHLTTPVIPEAEVNGPVASESQLKTLQDSVQDLEQKYRSTMVNIAQLDNERQALSYQVDCLKERLEDEEETAENLRAELAQRCKEFSRLSYENKKNVEEIERLQLMLGERDRILEEHNINLEEELMGITATDGISPRTSESINMNESVEIDHSVSSGGMKSRGSSRRSSVPDDKEILLEQIRSLKEEVSELRRENDTETVRVKDVAMEEMRTASWEQAQKDTGQAQVNEFEGSTFVDVSGEAEDMEPEPAGGYVVNNNEKNEDFEVIDHNLQPPGGLPDFEDKSYEGISNASLASESLGSLEVSESVDSEMPVEISVSPGIEPDDLLVTVQDHRHVDASRLKKDHRKDSTKDYPDYDIVEDAELKYSSDLEEGARIRSRYFSLPPEEDDGFETPPESEDDLRKLSGSGKSSGAVGDEIRGEDRPEPAVREDKETTVESHISGFQGESNGENIIKGEEVKEGVEAQEAEKKVDGTGNEGGILTTFAASKFVLDAEAEAPYKEAGLSDEKEADLFESADSESPLQGLLEKTNVSVDTEVNTYSSKDEESQEVCALQSELSGVVALKIDQEGDSEKDAEEEKSKMAPDLEGALVLEKTASAHDRESAKMQIEDEEVKGNVLPTGTERDEMQAREDPSVIETTPPDSVALSEPQSCVLHGDVGCNSQNEEIESDRDPLADEQSLVEMVASQTSPCGAVVEEIAKVTEVKVEETTSVKEVKGSDGGAEKDLLEGDQTVREEEEGMNSKLVGTSSSSVEVSDVLTEALDPNKKHGDAVDKMEGQGDKEAAEGESSPVPVPKKRKKKKGKKKKDQGKDSVGEMGIASGEEVSSEALKVDEVIAAVSHTVETPSVHVELALDGGDMPASSTIEGGETEENSRITATSVDSNSSQESGARSLSVSEVDPKNEDDSDQSGNEGGKDKKRKSKKSKKEQKKEGCKNQ